MPDALLAKTAELKKYFDASVEYVSGLKPKPTTKKKLRKQVIATCKPFETNGGEEGI